MDIVVSFAFTYDANCQV